MKFILVSYSGIAFRETAVSGIGKPAHLHYTSSESWEMVLNRTWLRTSMEYPSTLAFH